MQGILNETCIERSARTNTRVVTLTPLIQNGIRQHPSAQPATTAPPQSSHVNAPLRFSVRVTTRCWQCEQMHSTGLCLNSSSALMRMVCCSAFVSVLEPGCCDRTAPSRHSEEENIKRQFTNGDPTRSRSSRRSAEIPIVSFPFLQRDDCALKTTVCESFLP